MESPKIIMGVDAGVNNHATVIIQNRKIIHASLTNETIRDLKFGDEGFVHHFRKYEKHSRYLINKYKPDIITIERFQARQRGGGTTIERIGTMIGALASFHLEKMEQGFVPVIASEWKLTVHREKGNLFLDNLYKKGKTKKIAPHYIDAALIAIYGDWKTTGKKGECYWDITTHKLLAELGNAINCKKNTKKRVT